MMPKRSNELPKEILDRLGRIVAQAGNTKEVKEDPIMVLAMLLYGIEERLSVDDGDIRYLISEYCSPFGISIRSHHLKEKMIA